jgi:hypothetical protein
MTIENMVSSPRVEHTGECSRSAEGAPQTGSLLDVAFDPPEHGKHHNKQPASQSDWRQVIMERQLRARPVPLVGFIPRGEIESLKSLLDRMAQELVQLRSTRTEA